MQANALLVLPNQMYHKDILRITKQVRHVIVIEEPIYFYDRSIRPIKPCKIKIAYMRACMKFLEHSLKNTKHTIHVTYVEYKDAKSISSILSKFRDITMFHANDHAVQDKYMRMAKDLSVHLNVLESPCFLANGQWLQEYANRVKGSSPRHATFYDFMKTKLNIHELVGVPNMDAYNRQKPKHPISDVMRNYSNKQTASFYKEAIDYSNKHFATHIGTPDMVVLYPITTRDAEQQLSLFINLKLSSFGPYQDAVQQDAVVMSHSFLSASMNIGLLSPWTVVNKTLQNWDKHPLQSTEGFLRQVVGWREYMRYLYMFHCKDMIHANTPQNKKSIDPSWYTGTTGMAPVDKEIHKALVYGYAHHIVRLMVFLNQFILQEVDPKDVYKWFMEVVCMDAYDWVMVPNIWAMGYFWPNAMRKPYISSSNYILKMSDYKKDGRWDTNWTSMYHRFIKHKPKEYVKAYMRTL